MIPGINPKQLKQAMKQLGMKQEEIDAKEVIIRTSEKQLVIKNPSVVRINMMGQDSFQVTGEVNEESLEKWKKEDIDMVSKQAGVNYEKARKALEKEGDIAGAILALQQDKT